MILLTSFPVETENMMKKMRQGFRGWVGFALLPLFMCFGSGCGSSRQPVIESSRELINRKGPDVALQTLFADRTQWTALLTAVASGDIAALDVAKHLRPASDAGATTELDLAVGEALFKSPSVVLRTAEPAFRLDTVCGAPDVDDLRYASEDAVRREIHNRRRAVQGVVDPALRQNRDRCDRALAEAEQTINGFFHAASESSARQ
jgi:hypothetical protein